MASKEDYIVHKPAELSTVHKRRQEEIRAGAITRYWMLPKYDGCCTVIKMLPTGGYEIMSRVGKGPYPSMEAAAREAAATLSGLIRHHGGLVIIGEAWSPDYPHNEISGEFRRQVESDWLNLMAFDCIPLADFEAGKCAMPYRARRAMLSDFENGTRVVLATNNYAYHDLPAVQKMTNHLTGLTPGNGGVHDGLIMVDPDGAWERGLGKTGEWLKFKRLLTFDLRVLEVNTEVGAKTGRTVYKLVVDYDGKRLGVGSGLPHKEAEVPKVGDIVEVHAMDYSADGLLREPRYKGIRFDKAKADFE